MNLIPALVFIGAAVVVFGPASGFLAGPAVFIALSGISLLLSLEVSP